MEVFLLSKYCSLGKKFSNISFRYALGLNITKKTRRTHKKHSPKHHYIDTVNKNTKYYAWSTCFRCKNFSTTFLLNKRFSNYLNKKIIGGGLQEKIGTFYGKIFLPSQSIMPEMQMGEGGGSIHSSRMI